MGQWAWRNRESFGTITKLDMQAPHSSSSSEHSAGAKPVIGSQKH